MQNTDRMVVLPVHLELQLYENLRKEALKRRCSMAYLVRLELKDALWNGDATDSGVAL